MPGEVIVLELSCHQLEHIRVSPRIAVLLNLYEEHLDHYGTMAKYVRAKQNIYAWQREGDILFCSVDVLPGKEIEGAGKESACVPCRGEVISAVMVPEGEKARGAGDIGRERGPLQGQRPAHPGGGHLPVRAAQLL